MTPTLIHESVRCRWEHLFVHNPNDKGNVAEAAIAFRAVALGLSVSKPLTEHGRYDLVIEVAEHLYRVQCKWGRILADGNSVSINLCSSRWTPRGQIRTKYQAGEVDLVAVYCGELDRCYLLPERLVIDRRATQLRLVAPRNGQRSCI